MYVSAYYCVLPPYPGIQYLGGYCDRQRTAFVLLETQRPALLYILHILPAIYSQYLRAPLHSASGLSLSVCVCCGAVLLYK